MQVLFYIIGYLSVALVCVLITFYAERKLSAFIQDRMGPMVAGKYGWLQAVADVLKLFQKEEILHTGIIKPWFQMAPVVVFVSVFAGLVMLPLAPGIIPIQSSVGIYFLLAIVSLDVLGIVLAGWGSNSKFSIFGALRGASQLVSYEIPLGICVLAMVLQVGSLNLSEVALAQGTGGNQYLFGLHHLGISTANIGGIVNWNIIQYPFSMVLFVVFYIATLAECNRAPFDLPEGESELVSGFHTEYSGFRFALFFLAEYTMMFLLSAVAVVLFLGAGHTPFPNIGTFELANYTGGTPGTIWHTLLGLFWMLLKTLLLTNLQVVIRWTYPRLRADQLITLCWKYLIPIALAGLLVSALWKVL